MRQETNTTESTTPPLTTPTYTPKDGDIINVQSSVVQNIFVAADTIDCESRLKSCGQIYGSLENNIQSNWVLKQSSGQPNSYCFMTKETEAFLGFEPGICGQEGTDFTKCSIPRLYLDNRCSNDNSWILLPSGDNYLLQSVKYTSAFLYFEVENCKEMMNSEYENSGLNYDILRCGNIHIYYVRNIQSGTENQIDNLKFKISPIQETSSSTSTTTTEPTSNAPETNKSTPAPTSTTHPPTGETLSTTITTPEPTSTTPPPTGETS